MAGSMHVFGFLLCFSLTVSGQVPKITSTGQDINIYAAEFKFWRTDPTTGVAATKSTEIVTQDLLNEQFSERDLSNDFIAFENKGELDVLRKQNQQLNATNQQLNQSLRTSLAAQTKLQTELQELVDEVRTLAIALDTRLPPSNSSCSPRVTLSHGTTSGHLNHTYAGAVRTLACDAGYALNASLPTVVCGSDGKWSDGGAAMCIPYPTDTPTPAPTDYPYELVTCCLYADNVAYGVYIDGVQLHIQDNTMANAHWLDGAIINKPARFTFPSNRKVLGIMASDSECGCKCGSLTLSCATPSGNGPWGNVWTPGKGGEHDHLSGNRRFSIYSAAKTRYHDWSSGMVDGQFPVWTGLRHDGTNQLRLLQTEGNFQGNFSKPDFDAPSKNFVLPRSETPGIIQFQDTINATAGCPTWPATSDRRTSVCGGVDPPKAYTPAGGAGSDRTVTFWWLRYDTRTQP